MKLQDLDFGVEQIYEEECTNHTSQDVILEFSLLLEKKDDWPFWKAKNIGISTTSPEAPGKSALSKYFSSILGGGSGSRPSSRAGSRKGSLSGSSEDFKVMEKVRSNSVLVKPKISGDMIGKLDPKLKSYLDDHRSEKIDEKKAIIHSRKAQTKSRRVKSGEAVIKLQFQDIDDVIEKKMKSSNVKFDEKHTMHHLFRCLETDDQALFLDFFKKKDINPKWVHPEHNCTILQRAVQTSKHKFVELMIENGADANESDDLLRTPLMIASKNGNLDIALYLISKGAKINQKDSYGYSPLFLALKNHQFHLIEDFLLFGADINQKRDHGISPLHETIIMNDFEMLAEIIKIKSVKLNQKDMSGKTPILKACEVASVEIFFKFFGYQGVDYTQTDEVGRNMFHLLAMYKRDDILEKFASFGKSFEFQNLLVQKDSKRSQIPLHLAVESKNFKVIKYLLTVYQDNGADCFVLDQQKLSPYDITLKFIIKDYEKQLRMYDSTNTRSGELSEIFKKLNPELVTIEHILYPIFKQIKKK